MSETRFYVELPADEGGNTSQPLAVVAAVLHPHGGPATAPCTNPGRPVMVASAPAEITRQWGMWYADAYGGWKEVPGPARMLTREEWSALVTA